MIAGVFLVIGFALAVFGVMSLSEATMGVGLIGLACFFGIVARLAQARTLATEAAKAPKPEA